MQPSNSEYNISRLPQACSVTKLCFGTAAVCLVIGLVGYAINALTTVETTLHAFLVIGALYLILGIAACFKKVASPNPSAQPQESRMESAA